MNSIDSCDSPGSVLDIRNPYLCPSQYPIEMQVTSELNAYMIDHPGHTSQSMLDDFIFDSSPKRASSNACGALLQIDDLVVEIARLRGQLSQKRHRRGCGRLRELQLGDCTQMPLLSFTKATTWALRSALAAHRTSLGISPSKDCLNLDIPRRN